MGFTLEKSKKNFKEFFLPENSSKLGRLLHADFGSVTGEFWTIVGSGKIVNENRGFVRWYFVIKLGKKEKRMHCSEEKNCRVKCETWTVVFVDFYVPVLLRWESENGGESDFSATANAAVGKVKVVFTAAWTAKSQQQQQQQRVEGKRETSWRGEKTTTPDKRKRPETGRVSCSVVYWNSFTIAFVCRCTALEKQQPADLLIPV